MVTFEVLLQRLSQKLRAVSDEQPARAAVALLLKPVGESFKILIVKRTERKGDPWSGQMALPGGKREPQDMDLKATAMRETLEETGIDLSGSRFLGALSAGESVSKPGMVIQPFVFLLEGEPKIRLSRDELESYMWVPYEKFMASCERAKVPGVGEVPAYLLGDTVVWGVTCRILGEFSKAFEAVKKE